MNNKQPKSNTARFIFFSRQTKATETPNKIWFSSLKFSLKDYLKYCSEQTYYLNLVHIQYPHTITNFQTLNIKTNPIKVDLVKFDLLFWNQGQSNNAV